jgi:TRAP-type C4-dicarboxylate transport system substrate-binding protein
MKMHGIKRFFQNGVSLSGIKMFHRVLPTALALFLLTIVFSGAAYAKTLKLGHTVPPSHVWHKVADRFAKKLSEATQGKMKIRISPLSKLGNEPQMGSMLQTGALQFSILPVGVMSNREESMLGWFLPYLFQDVSQAGAAARLPASLQMLKNLEKHGMIGVGYTFAGMRHVLAVKSVTGPKDLERKKIRAFPSPIFNDWWTANGAAATALPLGEIAPSLTTNLLDAVDVDLDIVVGLKFHQQAPYLALTNHMAFPGVLLASKKWWDGLSDEDRAIINKVYREAELWGITTQAKAEDTNLEFLKKDGVEVSVIDLKSFQEVGKRITRKYISKNDLIKQFAGEVNASIIK